MLLVSVFDLKRKSHITEKKQQLCPQAYPFVSHAYWYGTNKLYVFLPFTPTKYRINQQLFKGTILTTLNTIKTKLRMLLQCHKIMSVVIHDFYRSSLKTVRRDRFIVKNSLRICNDSLYSDYLNESLKHECSHWDNKQLVKFYISVWHM